MTVPIKQHAKGLPITGEAIHPESGIESMKFPHTLKCPGTTKKFHPGDTFNNESMTTYIPLHTRAPWASLAMTLWLWRVSKLELASPGVWTDRERGVPIRQESACREDAPSRAS